MSNKRKAMADTQQGSARDANKRKPALPQSTVDDSSPAAEKRQAGSPSTSGGAITDGSYWLARCQELVEAARVSKEVSSLSQLLQGWPATEVRELLRSWGPEDMGVLMQGWSPQAMSALLQGRKPSFIAAVCESCSPEDIADLLPLLNTKKAGKVLGRLYFKAADPYLCTGECKRVLMSFQEGPRQQLLQKFMSSEATAALVECVLAADSDDESMGGTGANKRRKGSTDDGQGDSDDAENDGDEPGSSDPDAYEDSFIDDGPQEPSASDASW